MKKSKNYPRKDVERLLSLVDHLIDTITCYPSPVIPFTNKADMSRTQYGMGWSDARQQVVCAMGGVYDVLKFVSKLERQGRTGNSYNLKRKILLGFKAVVDAARKEPPAEQAGSYAQAWNDANDEILTVLAGALYDLDELI